MKSYLKTLCLLSLVALPLSNVLPQSGLITHPIKKAAKAKPKPTAPAPKPTPAPLPKVVMFGEANYKGETLTINENLPVLPAPLGTTEGGQRQSLQRQNQHQRMGRFLGRQELQRRR